MLPILRASAGVCLMAALAACGTTVPVTHQVGAGSTDGLSGTLQTPGAGGGVSAAGVDGATGSSALGTGSGSAGSAVSNGSSAGPAGSSGTDLTVGVGVSSKAPIVVGIAYVKDAAAGAAALGFQGATLGDMHLYSQTLVDDANAHGGLGGHKIVPVYFGYDANPGQPSWEQQDATACATFTQDNHIQIGIVTWAGTDLMECLRKKHIPMIAEGPTGGLGASTFAKYDQYVVMGGFNLDRRATEEVRTLVREKYFSKWDTTNGGPGVAPVKVGVITYDMPDWKESANGPLVKELKANGFTPQVIAVAPHDSYDNLSKMQAQISNAVLSFRANGITHVIIWDDNGVSTLFFMETADSQKYRPRYGINSGNNMQTVAKAVSANQLVGSIGMGFVPSMDVADGKGPTSKYSNAARKACYAVMAKRGVATGTGFNETSAMTYCSTFSALVNRWDAMANPSPAGIIASIEAYGTGFVDPLVPSTYLSGSHHDGLGGVYDYLYDGTCKCMTYSGGVTPLSHS